MSHVTFAGGITPTALNGAAKRRRANTLTSGVALAICEVLERENSQEPAAAGIADRTTRLSVAVSGIETVVVAVPPGIETIIERFAFAAMARD